MPDINAERLQNMIDCPESAEVSEVKSVAQLLLEAQDVLTLRNHQNRTLVALASEAGAIGFTAKREYALLRQRVITVSVGLALTAFAGFMWYTFG